MNEEEIDIDDRAIGECWAAFEKWYGFEISDDMDIQTDVAWQNWQIAWNAALANVKDTK